MGIPDHFFQFGDTRSFFPRIDANKHHRQHKFVRRSTKHSGVQSTCKMSRGWMMRRELSSEVLVGRAKLACERSDGLKLRRYMND